MAPLTPRPLYPVELAGAAKPRHFDVAAGCAVRPLELGLQVAVGVHGEAANLAVAGGAVPLAPRTPQISLGLFAGRVSCTLLFCLFVDCSLALLLGLFAGLLRLALLRRSLALFLYATLLCRSFARCLRLALLLYATVLF